LSGRWKRREKGDNTQRKERRKKGPIQHYESVG